MREDFQQVQGAGHKVIIPPGNLGIPRRDMPQIPTAQVPAFFQYLQQEGVTVVKGSTTVGSLKPTQQEINPQKVADMMGQQRDKLAKPVIISSDGYLLDGHHRWAALFQLDPRGSIPTIKVNCPIQQLLKLARGFQGASYKSFEEAMRVITEGWVPKALADSFVTWLREKGVSCTPSQMSTSQIAPTKDLEELDWKRIKKIVREFSPYQITKHPLLVSEDGHLFDGHHRWASCNEIDAKAPVPVIKLGMPFEKLRKLEQEFESGQRAEQDQVDQIVLQAREGRDPVQLIAKLMQVRESDGRRLMRLYESQGRIVKPQLNWLPFAESDLQSIVQRAGLRTRVIELPIEAFEFIQGALRNDDERHKSIAEAILQGRPLPPLMATPKSEGTWLTLDGHHRILATVQTLWPPYPKMRTIEVTYKNGAPFTWKDNDASRALMKQIPGYRKHSEAS